MAAERSAGLVCRTVEINVNGQSYDRWEDVPAEVRQQLAATLPDADKNGVPDLFEGNLSGLPQGAQTFSSASIMVNGKTVSSASDLPPEIQEQLQQALGMLGPMFGTAAASRRTRRPRRRTSERAVAAAARAGDAQRRPDHRRGRPAGEEELVAPALRGLTP